MFTNRLREFREKAGLSQSELARRAGIAVKSLKDRKWTVASLAKS